MRGLPFSVLIGCLVVLVVSSVGSAEPTDAALRHFETKVRPLLAEKCLSCHGPEKTKGGLRLDSEALFRKGGDSGPILDPDEPDGGRLVEVVKYQSDLKMPPKGKLKEHEIAAISEWVKAGAPWPKPDSKPAQTSVASKPREITAEDRDFWAFRPIRDSIPPRPRDRGQSSSPIDDFILARLESQGIEPAPPADKRTLIRRVTFDLIGLPPTPEETTAFLADAAPDAYRRLVDRLLASPRYGERWGRHWLDVARYADSNGMDENLAHALAYRYRDYAIAAFNGDLPYDRFIREQIAGDLLKRTGDFERDVAGVVATGFLSIGPKMLAEDDPLKMEMDIVDEQVDTVGRAFLGLTIGCARCHDHKFDPIPTADYYGLAGIFKSTKTMDHFRVVARWHERPLASSLEEETRWRKADEEITARNEEIKKLRRKGREEALKDARDRAGEYVKAALELIPAEAALKNRGPLMSAIATVEAEDYARGNVVKDRETYGKEIGVVYNRGELPNLAEYDVQTIREGTHQLEIRYAAAESRPVVIRVDGKVLTREGAKTATGSWYPDGQRWSIEAIVNLKAGKHTISLERDGPFPHFDKLALVPVPGPNDVAPRTAEQIAESAGLNPAFLRQWSAYLSKQGGKAPAAEKLGEIGKDPKGPNRIPGGEAEVDFFSKATGERARRLSEELKSLEKSRPVLPEAMAVEDGTVGDLKIHIRGNHMTQGDLVKRGFLRVVSSSTTIAPREKSSGRLELADWLSSRENPLTARVLVNRVWKQHFGEGLVRSPDNFGKLGERPTHPELLDWLATRFVESGWSIKAIHRLILNSSAYQMSVTTDSSLRERDPENLLLARANRRRLEAEAVRDAILAVGGRLDSRMGGPTLPTADRAYVNNTGSGVGSVKYDMPRRSVYLPVVRSGLYPMLQAFDFADPSTPNGRRDSTVVAPQALFVLNDESVLKSAAGLADRLLKREDLDDAGRVKLAHLLTFNREPSPAETKNALEFLDRFESALRSKETDSRTSRLRAWKAFGHALIGSSEFLYIE